MIVLLDVWPFDPLMSLPIVKASTQPLKVMFSAKPWMTFDRADAEAQHR